MNTDWSIGLCIAAEIGCDQSGYGLETVERKQYELTQQLRFKEM